MVRWLRWHCPPDTEFEIRALAVWGRARYLSVTAAETVDNFITDLYNLAEYCELGALQGEMIRDRLVVGLEISSYQRNFI